jgi:hypothetical protein
MGNIKCVGRGFQIGQFVKNFEEDEEKLAGRWFKPVRCFLIVKPPGRDADAFPVFRKR